jgi:energy-converting hydrogenase B subunit D
VIPLQVVSLALVAIVGTIVVLVRDPLRQVILISFYGLALVALFMIFQAPDVALSMLVVGAIAYPLVVLVAVARVRGEPHDPREERER